MVRIQPFRALRYDARKAPLARVTAPPHDVLTAAEKERARAEAHSIVHLALPEEGGEEGRFALAARRLAQWRDEGVLARDRTPALYGYEVAYGEAGGRRRMRGLFAKVGLDATHREVRPHERTLARKKGDRLRLRQATQCDIEPIWLLYRDPSGNVDAATAAGEPVAEFTAADGTHHRLWRVSDPLVLQDVQAWFGDQSTVIADGHHRYQSALEHSAATGRPEDASILALLVRDGDPGVRVEATHRIVRWGRSLPEALAACRVAWRPVPLREPIPVEGSWGAAARTLLQSLEGAGTAILVGRSAGGLQAHGLWLEAQRASRDLAVTLVQERLLAECWGLEDSASGQVAYERDAAECLRQVADGEADLAVLIPPERVQSVLDAARDDRLMPPKATYFVPKPASGLVMAPLDEV